MYIYKSPFPSLDSSPSSEILNFVPESTPAGMFIVISLRS